MKRQLTKEEKELTNRNISINEKELKELKENLDYNQSLIIKQNYLRDHDDKWRDFLRRQKDREDENVLKTISQAIREKENIINIAKDQVKNGVETKEVQGVG